MLKTYGRTRAHYTILEGRYFPRRREEAGKELQIS
jgi:hypothetical protein